MTAAQQREFDRELEALRRAVTQLARRRRPPAIAPQPRQLRRSGEFAALFFQIVLPVAVLILFFWVLDNWLPAIHYLGLQ